MQPPALRSRDRSGVAGGFGSPCLLVSGSARCRAEGEGEGEGKKERQ